MGFGTKIADKFLLDENFTRARRGIVQGAKGFGPGAVQYLVNKVPIFQWLPNYSPRWLIADVIAGQSVGLLLIPQALMFSTLAGVPMIEGLWAAWLPGLIYTIMGTSKDISIGPTSSISLLVNTILLPNTKLAPTLSPSLIASVLALAVGIWSIVFGVLNLGFIFDFIAFPIVLGFVAGLSQVVILTQVPAILGLVGVGPDALSIMGQIISKITETKPVTVGMSVASLLLLGGLSFVGRKWGANNQSIRILSTSRNIIVIGLMTLISYILNKNLEVPLWSVTEPTSTTIPAPKVPLMALFNELFLPSGTIFLGMALEHVALTKFMGHKNGYNINASQELVSLGVTNIANSVMGGFPVGGGDMARASVNSFSGVKSPLGGLISSSIVLASMFALSDFIKFIPQFTIAAVIMVATVENMPPMAYIGKFWKLSFLDFVGFLISFNVTLVRDATEGIVIALIVMMVSTVGRAMFSWSRTITRRDVEQQYLSELNKVWATADRLIIPPGTQVIGIERELLYLNASRMKRHILDTVFTHNSGKPMGIFKDPTRSWDYRREKHIAALRRKAGLGGADTYSPHLRILVLDFTNTPFIDSTAVQVLEEIKTELREYGGDVVNFRFVGLNAAVRKRFQRAGWPLQNYRDADKSTSENRVETKEVDEDREVLVEKADVLKAEVVKDLVFEILPTAILYQSQARISDSSHAEDLILQKQI